MSLVLNGLLGGVPAATPPVVSNITPTPGIAISASQAVGLRVTDDSGLFRRIFLEVEFPALGLREVIHDGESFAALYTPSTRTAVAGPPAGFDFSLKRVGGWPAAPTFSCFAIDQQGSED